MKLACRFAICLFAFSTLSIVGSAQSGLPRYCKTDVGILGPYPSDPRVHVGDSCFGTKNGQRYEGTAVMSKTGEHDDPSPDSKDSLPRYCKTDVGVLGPYPSDPRVHVGDSCFGTKNGQRYDGTAVMSRSGD